MTPLPDDLFIALRAFVLSLLPNGTEVIQGLGNNVPMPEGGFVCMTALSQRRLSTNHSELLPSQERIVTMPTEYSIQVDCYGPDSSDWATLLTALWRDPYGCDAMAPVAQPLYHTDPIQAPLVNGEENYEQRWVFTALLQFNPSVTVVQQSADTLDLVIVSVDAEFPST